MRNIFPFILFLLIVACQEPAPQSQAIEPLPPIHEDMVEIDSAEIYYKFMGKGEPMILVHGGPGLDHSYFLPQMEILAPYFSLFFYDQLASGKSSSDVPPDRFTIQSFVEDIEGMRKSLGLDKIHLLGHSWGGYLAMEYATRYPENLTTLILLNPMSPNSAIRAKESEMQGAQQTAEEVALIQQITTSEAYKNKEASAYEDLFRLAFRKTFYHKSLVDSLTLTLPNAFAANSLKLQGLGKDLIEYNVLPALAQVETPTLLIYGAHDPLKELAGDSIMAYMPGVRYEVIEECGHFPYIEQPEAFLKVMKKWRGR